MIHVRTNKVLLIYTGGTIGMGVNRSTGALQPLDFNHLVNNLAEFEYLKTEVDTYQFTPPIDSSDMSPAMWAALARLIEERYSLYDGFVVLHGTDTMAYTASALSFMLQNLTKPVILTGSQLPIGLLRTDGKENLITSIELAAAHNAQGFPMVPEVCIYFKGALMRGNRSTKCNADGFDAFESFNYPHLCHVGVNIKYDEHSILSPRFDKPLRVQLNMTPNVVVLSLFPGIQESITKHIFDAPELQGVIIRSFGSGNAPHERWLIKLLETASAHGVTIINISQCVSGRVEMQRYETGHQLKNAGVISGFDSTVEAAVTKLMHLKACHSSPQTINKLMQTPLAGEITLS